MRNLLPSEPDECQQEGQHPLTGQRARVSKILRLQHCVVRKSGKAQPTLSFPHARNVTVQKRRRSPHRRLSATAAGATGRGKEGCGGFD